MNDITTDELFQLVMIDKKKKVKVHIFLKDEDGDDVSIREVVEKMVEFVGDKLKSDKDNQCKDTLFPLMGQAIVGGITKLVGQSGAAYLLSDEIMRYSLMHMMTVGFCMMKWLNKKNIKIHTTEEPISQVDIDMYERIGNASDLTVKGAMIGADPKEIVKSLLKSGRLQRSDLSSLGVEIDSEGDNEGMN